MKRNRIYAGVVIAVLLIMALLYRGETNGTEKNKTPDISVVSENVVIKSAPKITKSPEISQTPKSTITPSPEPTPKASIDTEPKHEATPTPVPFQNPEHKEEIPEKEADEPTDDEELTCILSVSCAEVLNNMDKLKEGKAELIPKDGIIYSEQEVVFYEGESVFNVLLREMKKNKIHLEFVDTPMYNSTYIEGIGNLYEFDCSELSGWRFKINGEFINYSCSGYEICDGDKIEWVYTCDWKSDMGEEFSEGI